MVATSGIDQVCNMMERAIAHIAQEIENKGRQVAKKKGQLSNLQSKPNQDPDLISAIKEEIRNLEHQLELDRAQLNAFQDEFNIQCRS